VSSQNLFSIHSRYFCHLAQHQRRTKEGSRSGCSNTSSNPKNVSHTAKRDSVTEWSNKAQTHHGDRAYGPPITPRRKAHNPPFAAGGSASAHFDHDIHQSHRRSNPGTEKIVLVVCRKRSRLKPQEFVPIRRRDRKSCRRTVPNSALQQRKTLEAVDLLGSWRVKSA
jgi:hypothetical protein